MTARMLYNGASGVAVNRAKAAEYFKMAADNVQRTIMLLCNERQGNVDGAVNIAVMYEEGSDVAMDLDLALKYFQFAAQQVQSSSIPAISNPLIGQWTCLLLLSPYA